MNDKPYFKRKTKGGPAQWTEYLLDPETKMPIMYPDTGLPISKVSGNRKYRRMLAKLNKGKTINE